MQGRNGCITSAGTKAQVSQAAQTQLDSSAYYQGKIRESMSASLHNSFCKSLNS